VVSLTISSLWCVRTIYSHYGTALVPFNEHYTKIYKKIIIIKFNVLQGHLYRICLGWCSNSKFSIFMTIIYIKLIKGQTMQIFYISYL